MMTIDDVLTLLNNRKDQAGSVSAAARVLGVSQQMLEPVLAGRRDPGPLLLRKLGLRKVVAYESIRRKRR